MAYQKLQVSSALNVIPGFVKIPDPNTVVVLDTATNQTLGTGNFGALNTLTTVGTKFTEAGILPGAIIYNTTSLLAYYVVSVDSDTQLTLSFGSAGGAADKYSIYTQATKGCILYIGKAGNVSVQMAEMNGNYTAATAPLDYFITFNNIAQGSFMPTQVVLVGKNTTAADIIALW
mgnify:FL=1